MKNETTLKPREIREDIGQAFINNYAVIQNAAFEEWADLTVFGAEQIMMALAANLNRYRRPAGDRFISWAEAWVKRETRRHRFLVAIHRDHPRLMYAAINRSLFSSPAEDIAVEPADNEADLYVHLLEYPRKIDMLMKPVEPGKAKHTTQLYALTKSRMRGYRTKINERRALLIDPPPVGYKMGGCEFVTSLEKIAETKLAPRIEEAA